MAITAACVFMGQLIGTIIITQQDPESTTSFQGEIRNLTEGMHGFHIHEYGDIRNNCLAAGSHYNPFNVDHAGPDDQVRHIGDQGNIMANSNGVASISIQDKFVKLEGIHSVIGRSIVVHKLQDDYGRGGDAESKKTGNAGPRLDCCIIGLSKSA